jgi:hypothetical protein
MTKQRFQDELKYMYGVSGRPILFFIGVLIAGIAGNLAYELAHDLPQWKMLWKAWIFEFIAIGVLFVVVILLNRYFYDPKLEKERMLQMWRWARPKSEEGLKHSYQGIIWLLSPDEKSIDIAQYAIREHKLGLGDEEHGKGNLKVCWCIYGTEEESVKEEFPERIKELKNKLRAKNVRIPEDVKFEEYPIAKPDAQHTFDAVNDIYQNKIKDYGLEPHQVVADITGGFASMSAGMAIACSRMKAPVEYIQVLYLKDSSGNVYRSTHEENWNHIIIDPQERVSTAAKETS